MVRVLGETLSVPWMAGPIVGNRPPLSQYHYQYATVTNYLGAQGYWYIASIWSPIAGRAWRSRLGIRQPRRSQSEMGVNPYFSRVN